MDINDDLRVGITHELLTVLGLHEVILDHHNDLSPPPATQNCNKRQQPIDGIWATPRIKSSREDILNLETCATPTITHYGLTFTLMTPLEKTPSILYAHMQDAFKPLT
jgi:hypothetical protein